MMAAAAGLLGGAAAAPGAGGSIMSQTLLAILKVDSLVQSRQNSRTSSPPGRDTTASGWGEGVCACVCVRVCCE